MKNTTNAAIYGVGGGAIAYGLTCLLKTKKPYTHLLIVAGLVVGAIVGNNS